MKNKAKIILFLLLFTVSALCFSGCGEPAQKTPEPTQGSVTDTPALNTAETAKTTEATETSEAPDTQNKTDIAPAPTASPTPTATQTSDAAGDPRYDSADAIGPFVFGEDSYKIYIGDSLIIFNTDKTVHGDLGEVKISDKELFALTVSFIDINFDEIPDFSYFEPDGRRICYLANADGSGYTYSDALSSLYDLTRCYETQELFAAADENFEEYYSYKFADGELVQGEALSNRFIWDITSISDALAGANATVTEAEETEIRGVMCKTYTVGGYITVAVDSYGNFYIKDMPHRGFCRLALNPNGRWSKSEKVTEDLM